VFKSGAWRKQMDSGLIFIPGTIPGPVYVD